MATKTENRDLRPRILVRDDDSEVITTIKAIAAGSSIDEAVLARRAMNAGLFDDEEDRAFLKNAAKMAGVKL